MPRHSVSLAHSIVPRINFPQSAEYYRKALESDPKNLGTHTQLASSLYYAGDVDEALQQLQQVLKTDPKNANALFILGMMKWKSTVEQMIAEAKSQPASGKAGSTTGP
jgi:cytochrome c-type biogenesis protein CcmH/NrfG